MPYRLSGRLSPEATALRRVLGRYRTRIDTADLGLCAHLMLDDFLWEMPLTEALHDHVRPGTAAPDIGAHVGVCQVAGC